MESKLRRLFVMVNNVLRDWTVDQLAIGLKNFFTFLKAYTPEEVIIHNLNSA